MLTSKQRAALKSIANGLEAIFQVGKSGVGEALIKQVDDALEARELIKLSILETAPETPKEAAQVLAEATQSQVVQVIGRKAILYRANPDNPQIQLD